MLEDVSQKQKPISEETSTAFVQMAIELYLANVACIYKQQTSIDRLGNV